MKNRSDPPPRWYEEPEPILSPPICPCCGRETDDYLLDCHGEIAGCPECVRTVDAWDYVEEN